MLNVNKKIHKKSTVHKDDFHFSHKVLFFRIFQLILSIFAGLYPHTFQIEQTYNIPQISFELFLLRFEFTFMRYNKENIYTGG